MADYKENIEKKEAVSSAPRVAPQEDKKSPEGVGESRADIAGTLAVEEGGEMIDSGEVSETISEGKEKKSQTVKTGKKKDDSKTTTTTGDGSGATGFIYDDKNLPPAPAMIVEIEKQLRKDINKLEKMASKYQGSIFRRTDYPRYSETIIEIRKKNVMLRKLVTMAAAALKKLFVQMFSAKKASK